MIDAEIDGFFNLEGIPCDPGPYLTENCDDKSEKVAKESEAEEQPTSLAPCGQCDYLPVEHEPEASISAIPKVVSITSPNATGVIHNSTRKAMLGATIPLKANVSGGTNGVYEWKLGNDVVGSNSNILNQAITSLGNHSISVTYRIGSKRSLPKTVTINVIVPIVSNTLSFIEQDNTQVVEGSGCFGFFDPRYYLTTGCPQNYPGVIMTAWIKDPGSYISNPNESRLKIVQIVNTWTKRINTSNNSCEVLTRRGTQELEWMLDDADPYGSPNNPAVGTIEIGSGPNITTNDTPNVKLANNYNISVDDKFETYIVYFTGTNEQPMNEKAIGVAEWSYGGSTRYLASDNSHEEVPDTLFPADLIRIKATQLTPTNQGSGIRQYDRTRVQTLNTWRPCEN